MGRMIDDHIEVLKSYHHGFTGCAGNLQDSIDVAVDIMHKYQKIKSKIKVLRHFTEDTPLATQRMIRIINEIGEVLKDGDDD